MGRYRPPAEKQSPYITQQGFASLQQESRRLWLRRSEVTLALSAAAAEGDRSENAEYIYRKKELREIDRRIRYLQKRLPDLIIVKQLPDDLDTVYFAAWVTLEDEHGHSVNYRIVGADEIDPAKNYISADSPMAKALLKRHPDDIVMVHTPLGTIQYTIIDINYQQDTNVNASDR